MRGTILGLFPWLSHVTYSTTRALAIGSATKLLELVGGTRDASGVGDLAVRLCRDSVSGLVYVSTSITAPYSWTLLAQVVGAPGPADAGTEVRILTGTERVKIP